MFSVFISGIVCGLTIAIMIGPSFFSLIQTSIHRGFRSGMYLAIGISLSDLAFVMLSYLGISQIINEPGNQLLFGIIGGAILIGYGAYTFMKKVKISIDSNEDEQTPLKIIKLKKPAFYTYIIKGFFLNLANPFLIIFWMGIMGFVSANYGTHSAETYTFFTGTLLTVLATDLIKCFIGKKTKQFLNPKLLSFLNHLLGIILIVFGLVLIFRVIF